MTDRKRTDKNPGGSGMLEKFLSWIARGANHQAMGKPACPT